LPDLLKRELGALCAGATAEVRIGEPTELEPTTGNDKRNDPVLYSVIAVGLKEVMMVASLPCRAVLSLVDLALGGSGKDYAVPSGKLPLSAQLMFGRFEKMLIAVLVEALGLTGPDGVKLKTSGAAAEAYTPFAICKRTVLPVEVTIAGAEPWELLLAFRGSTAATLFAGRSEGGKSASPASRRSSLSPHLEPFGAVSVPLKAVLVDMTVPLSVLSNLKPGAVFPVSVARSVPLIAGEQVIAHGTVGAMEDRAALQLTKIASIKEK
jgi:flagellar motor switch protein FliM